MKMWKACVITAISLIATGFILSAKARQHDQCAHFLELAETDIATYRTRALVGIDALRLRAVVHLTDYLVCKERNR